MDVEWKVDAAVHSEGWGRIIAITGDVSAMSKNPSLILDLGGGPGWFGLHLAKMHPAVEVLSLDVTPKPVEAKVSHVKGSALDIPLKGSTADIIGANAILHHVPDDVGRCAREIFRVLKPGGRLLAQEPLYGNPPARWVRKFVRTSAHEEGERPLPYWTMENALLASGLEIEKAEFFFLTSYLMPHIIPMAPKGLQGMLRKKGLFLVRMDRALLEKFPGLSRYAAYVSIVARKSI